MVTHAENSVKTGNMVAIISIMYDQMDYIYDMKGYALATKLYMLRVLCLCQMSTVSQKWLCVTKKLYGKSTMFVPDGHGIPEMAMR